LTGVDDGGFGEVVDDGGGVTARVAADTHVSGEGVEEDGYGMVYVGGGGLEEESVSHGVSRDSGVGRHIYGV